MELQCFVVDAFTDVPFRGNPAGVCLLDEPLSDELMQQVASELNCSETAFVTAIDGGGRFSIRYFSPKQEIPLCGHATLASAKVLLAADGSRELCFVTLHDLELPVRGAGERIEMEFPIYTTRPAEAPEALCAALGLESVLNVAYNEETGILLLEIEETGVLAGLRPDFDALYRSHDAIQGVLVTAASDGEDGHDFHSRYFWPWSGSNEDPVTGGTHTFLAGYWSERLGKSKMSSFQASQRTGSMEVELKAGQLLIRGHAVIVLEGRILV